MSGEPDGFLSRWSQRKRRSRDEPERASEARGLEARDPEAPAAGDAPLPDRRSGDAPAVETVDEEQVAALPEPETLGIDDDFKPFMRPGVPAALKRRALRRLWTVNPFFNVRDGLDDYDEDYTDAATVVPNLRTLFEPGKGMPQPERWRKPEALPEPGGEPSEEGPEQIAAPVETPAAAHGLEAEVEAEDETPVLGEDPAAVPVSSVGPAGRPRRGAAQRRWSGFSPAGQESPAGVAEARDEASAPVPGGGAAGERGDA